MSSPGSLAVTVTALRTNYELGEANPANYYHLGLLRLGTAHGYLPAFPIDADTQLIPCPAGVTHVGYVLFGGTTIDLEERAEIPWAGPPGPTGPAGPTGSTGATGATGATGSTVITDTNLSGSAANIDFTSIPNTYTSLEVEYLLRGDQNVVSNSIFCTFNGDTGSNYTWLNMNTGGASVVPGGALNTTHFICGTEPALTSAANVFAAGRLWIAFYQSGQWKVIEWQTYQPKNGTTTEGVLYRGGGAWQNTAALTEITLTPQSGNFVAGSRARLIGS